MTIEERAKNYSSCDKCHLHFNCAYLVRGRRCDKSKDEEDSYYIGATEQKAIDIDNAIDYLVANGFFGCKDSVGAEGLRRHMKGGEE